MGAMVGNAAGVGWPGNHGAGLDSPGRALELSGVAGRGLDLGMALALILQAGRSNLVASLGADWTLADVPILRPVLLAVFGQVLGRTLFQGLLLTIVGGALWWYGRRKPASPTISGEVEGGLEEKVGGALWWYGRRKPASPTISGEVEGGLEEKAAPEKAEDADAGPMASPPPVAALDEDKEPPGPPPSAFRDLR